MPSKKKSKPSYNVPEELQTAPQAGWVYRSDAPRSRPSTTKNLRKSRAGIDAEAVRAGTNTGKAIAPIPAPAPYAPPAAATPIVGLEKPQEIKGKHSQATTSKPNDGIMDLAARAISSSFEAMGTVVLLTTRIITAPISMGMKMLGLK